MSYLQNYWFRKNQKTNGKVFNIVANKNEAKAIAKHISFDCKCKLNSTTSNSNHKWNNKTCPCECKNYRKCKNDYSWNSSTFTCENSKYLKSVADTSAIACDEIIYIMDSVTTKMKNTIATNVSTYCHNKKVRYKTNCYIFLTALLVTILLLIIVDSIK